MYGTIYIVILILISSLPVFFVYIWFRAAKYQITAVRFLIIFFTGSVTFFPALFLQNLLNLSTPAGGRQISSQGELFYHIFVRVALTEELSRLLILIVFFWLSGVFLRDEYFSRSVSINSVKKGAAAGLVAGLGFAVIENTIYGVSDIGILLLRAVTAAPLHAACGSRVGAAAIMIKSNPLQAVMRLLAATAIHGIYNFLITLPGFPSIAAILVAFSALASSILTIRGGWSQPIEEI